MALQVLFFYGLGFLFLYLAINETQKPMNMVFTMLSIFTNTIAYYMSYISVDYTQVAYFPLVLAIVSVILLIYRAWMSIPTETDWNDSDDEEDNYIGA